MKNPLPISILTCCILGTNVQAQYADTALKNNSKALEPEKVHIQFDKDAYLPGETIWMKAYILSGSKPSEHSKNLYFDWTDNNGNLLLHSASPITESSAVSSFVIPADFRSSSIHLKSYTRWMLNFDLNFLFNKDLAVLAPWDGTISQTEQHLSTMRFFPEGGDLVNGLNSMVAFELTDQHGRPLHGKVFIKNNHNEVIDSAATIHNGMGKFTFRPLANEKFTASWIDSYGQANSVVLPQGKASGVVMHITPSANKIFFDVERVADGPDNLKSLILVGTLHDKLMLSMPIDLSTKTIVEGTIPIDRLPSGVLQLTVLDAGKLPIAERVVFVNNHEFESATQIKNEMINFARKSRNELSIELPDSLRSNLSVSITDGSLGYDSSSNIIADFLLTSDIGGNVINPAYYFSNNTDSVHIQLDLLMCTHGWRRFKWEDVAQGKVRVIQYPRDSDFIVVKGQLGSNSIFDASDSVTLLMITKDRKKHLMALPLDVNGHFIVRGLFFYDSIQVVYRVNHAPKLNGNLGVNLQTNFAQENIANIHAGIPVFQWQKVPELVLEKEFNSSLVESANYSRESAGMNFAFTPNTKKDSLKATSENASHYLQDNFPTMRFPAVADQTNSTTSTYASFASSQPSVPPQSKASVNVLLDGMAVGTEDLKQVSMKDILFIKFLEKSPTTKGLPTLSITTRQSLDLNSIMTTNTGFAVVRGYTPVKEFYSPQYPVNAMEDQSADFRTTLYWNPMIRPEKNCRKVKLVFYNNNISNKFRVVVEGFNKEGKLIRVEEIIK